MEHYIYLTTNLINGKKYIGKHFGAISDSYLGSGTLLQRAITKYGKENFKKEILYISKDEKENSEKEREFIKVYDAVKSDMFYNIHEGGDGGNTMAGWSEERKAEYAAARSIAMTGEKNHRYGTHLSEETKEKIRQNRDTSYMQTQEYRETMSKAVSGEKNGMYGRNHTEESKKKMSESHMGIAAGEKNGMYGKKGNNAINGMWIGMYDVNGNQIRLFKAKTAALEFLGLKGHKQLDKAIKEGTEYKGYFWKKEEKCRD